MDERALSASRGAGAALAADHLKGQPGMSTTGSYDGDAVDRPFVTGPPSSPDDAQASVDPQLVQQTKNEIRTLVREINQLAQANISVEQFHEEFLTRVTSALASNGGAIWRTTDGGGLELHYQINYPRAELVEDEPSQTRHALLLRNVLASGQPTLVPPRSGPSNDDDAGNPTDHLLILAPLRSDDETIGVVEVFQRANGGPTTQRGYLRFLVQMSELASDFLKNRRLRHLGDRQTLWENLESFTRSVHQGLDSRAISFTIVNEGRRIVECDRVSIALMQGSHMKVQAVSGLDTIDRRAAEIRELTRLSSVVTSARRPLWYTGDTDALPPQVDEPLHRYLDQSHSKVVGVVPLYPPSDEAESVEGETTTPEPLGALIVEQLGNTNLPEGMVERVDTVAVHGAAALANAREHESLFLLPVWRAIGKASWLVEARTLPKTVLVLAALAMIVASLVLIPADFDLGANGKLQPSVRRDVFAHHDGVVIDVAVSHRQEVGRGDVLARLANNDLDVDIENLQGRKRTTQERVRSLERSQLDNRRLTMEQRNQITGELLELQQVEDNIDRELALLRQKEEQLAVRSDLSGEVVTWNVRDLLMRRPVKRGDLLMTVVDPRGEWELELYMPERRLGHLAEAIDEQGLDLTVTFTLASHPGAEFRGRVLDVHRLAEVHGDEGNTVLVRVAIDKSTLPELRSDTTVAARVKAGRRSIGFVWFHELIETVHTKVLFWL